MDILPPSPSTTLLSAHEAKERLREIVEAFFFRQLRTETGSASGACLSKARRG